MFDNYEITGYGIIVIFILFYTMMHIMVKFIMSPFIDDTNYRIINLEKNIIELKKDIDDLEFDLQDRIRNL